MVPQSHLDTEAVTAILREYKIHNADVVLRCDATVDMLIDVVEGNRKYMPALYVLNKVGEVWVEACMDKANHIKVSLLAMYLMLLCIYVGSMRIKELMIHQINLRKMWVEACMHFYVAAYVHSIHDNNK